MCVHDPQTHKSLIAIELLMQLTILTYKVGKALTPATLTMQPPLVKQLLACQLAVEVVS